MRSRSIILLFALMLVAAAAPRSWSQAQDKSKRPSPPAKAECKFTDGKTVTVDYSQPSMKGRKIYGGLVPYGKVWRTGANEATSFVTNADLTIGATTVPAGSYTLFTLPAESGWKLIISKQTGQWGTDYKPGEDLARIDMKKEATSQPVETFTISFDQTGDSCTMKLEWENTRASVDIRKK